MKAGITELSETRRRLDVEIPAAEVDAAIDRLTRRRRGRTRVPGFRPGKAPLNIVRQRFREDILHDAASDLVPAAVETALQEHELNTVDTPDVREVSIEEGRPLTFHALFEVMPTIGTRPESRPMEAKVGVSSGLAGASKRRSDLASVCGRGAGAGPWRRPPVPARPPPPSANSTMGMRHCSASSNMRSVFG